MIIESTLLRNIPGIRYGFSTRSHGDMRKAEARKNFAQLLGLNPNKLWKPLQSHSNQISVSGDGLVSSGDPICVITADCVPIIAVDKEKKITGVAHAGWKGTASNIAKNLIVEMVKKGASKGDIQVAIGPRIDGNTYNVARHRARLFQNLFPKDNRVVRFFDDQWFVDLGEANRLQLLDSGINPEHIDLLPHSTTDQSKFFSYRKSSDASYGEMVAMIGVAA